MSPADPNAVARGLSPTGRRMVGFVLPISVLLILGAFLGILTSRDAAWITFFDNLHWTVAYSTAALLAWLGVVEAESVSRLPRRWFAVALTLYAIGQFLWDIQVAVGNNPFPGPSDLFYLWLGPCCLLGLLEALRRSVSRLEFRTVMLDAISLTGAVLMVTLTLYLPRRGGTDVGSILVMVAYPVGLLGAACVGVLMIPTLHLRAEPGWLVFLAALVLNGGLWMRWNILTLDDQLGTGTFFNASFSIAALLLGWGARYWKVIRRDDPVWERRCEWILRLLPLLVVIAASIAVVMVLTLPEITPAVRHLVPACAFVVAGFALARQSLLLRERDRMLDAQRQARELEFNYQALFETAQDGILILNGTAVEDCNPSALHLFGCGRRDLIGSSLLVFSPELQPDGTRSGPHFDLFSAPAVAGRPQFFEWMIRQRDGQEALTEVRLNLLEGGDRPRLQAVIRDVGERRKAEQELRQRLELESRFSKLARNVPGVLFALKMDPLGGVSLPYLSPKSESILGVRPESPGEDGRRLLARLHRDDVRKVIDSLRWSAESLSPWQEEFRTAAAYRGETWIEGRAIPEKQVTGDTLWHGILLDISQRRSAEVAMERGRRELQLILDSVPAMIFYKDRQHRILRVNAEAARITGLAREQVEGFTDRELDRAEASDYVRDEEEVMTTGVAKRGIVEPLQAAGGIRWMLTDKLPYRDESGQIVGTIGFSLDITERKRAEDERRKLAGDLLQSQKMEAIGQLAGGVAHDFNNVLAVIHCNASLLQDSIREPRSAELVNQILNAVDRAARMIRQLLLVGRRKPMEPADLEVGEVVTAMASLLRPLVGKAITIDIDVEPGVPRARADASMLEQVLLNLTVNARDAMPSGGMLKILVRRIDLVPQSLPAHPDARAGAFVRLSVVDQGSGIPPEVLPRIFEPFFSTKDQGKGTGLGLSTVYGIIREHLGWIDVETELGRGTSMHVYLPVAASEVVSSRLQPPPGGGPTILLVEDQQALRTVARALLDRLGYQVIEAPDGRAALEVWKTQGNRIDLLFTDLVMPNGVSGKDLAIAVRKDRPELPVLFTSGFSREMLDDPASKSSVPGGFLAKPYTAERLSMAVEKALRTVGVRSEWESRLLERGDTL